MPQPNEPTMIINLPTLAGGRIGQPDTSIYSAMNGGQSPFALSVWGGAGKEIPFRAPPQPNYGAPPTQMPPTPPPQQPQAAKSPFAMFGNPFAQMQQWQARVSPFVGKLQPVQSQKQQQGQGGKSGDSGMSADDKKWAGIAQKMGLNWQVTKDVYMNPMRNGSSNPAEALGRQLDDKTWGDVFMQVTGRPPNEREWVDHYNAGGNWNADPLVGHNDAIAEVERRRQELMQQY